MNSPLPVAERRRQAQQRQQDPNPVRTVAPGSRTLVVAFALFVLSDVIIFWAKNQDGSPNTAVYGALTGLVLAVLASGAAAFAGIFAAVVLPKLARAGDDQGRRNALIVVILSTVVFLLATPIALTLTYGLR